MTKQLHQMSEFVLFAHDTTITYSHSYVISNFDMTNSELQEVTNWFKANKLSVGATKTNNSYMLLGTNKSTWWKCFYYFRQYKFRMGKWY